MNKTARATLATKKLAHIRWYLGKGYLRTADKLVEYYYGTFGDTKGYRHIYRDVTTALYNARKEVK